MKRGIFTRVFFVLSLLLVSFLISSCSVDLSSNSIVGQATFNRCSDTDAGTQDPYLSPGTVELRKFNGDVWYSKSDECAPSNEVNVLVEYSCEKPGFELVVCRTECVESPSGAYCLEEGKILEKEETPTHICYDLDKHYGDFEFVRGLTMARAKTSSEWDEAVMDICVNENGRAVGNGLYVNETNCVNDGQGRLVISDPKSIYCPSGCENGKCIPSTCADEDGDGYGEGCVLGLDCDDQDSLVHPGREEIFDGKDQNCNGIYDEGIGIIIDRENLVAVSEFGLGKINYQEDLFTQEDATCFSIQQNYIAYDFIGCPFLSEIDVFFSLEEPMTTLYYAGVSGSNECTICSFMHHESDQSGSWFKISPNTGVAASSGWQARAPCLDLGDGHCYGAVTPQDPDAECTSSDPNSCGSGNICNSGNCEYCKDYYSQDACWITMCAKFGDGCDCIDYNCPSDQAFSKSQCRCLPRDEVCGDSVGQGCINPVEITEGVCTCKGGCEAEQSCPDGYLWSQSKCGCTHAGCLQTTFPECGDTGQCCHPDLCTENGCGSPPGPCDDDPNPECGNTGECCPPDQCSTSGCSDSPPAGPCDDNPNPECGTSGQCCPPDQCVDGSCSGEVCESPDWCPVNDGTMECSWDSEVCDCTDCVCLNGGTVESNCVECGEGYEECEDGCCPVTCSDAYPVCEEWEVDDFPNCECAEGACNPEPANVEACNANQNSWFDYEKCACVGKACGDGQCTGGESEASCPDDCRGACEDVNDEDECNDPNKQCVSCPGYPSAVCASACAITTQPVSPELATACLAKYKERYHHFIQDVNRPPYYGRCFAYTLYP